MRQLLEYATGAAPAPRTAVRWPGAAYLKEQSWYYDLARNWQGGFVYQKIEPGDENNNYTNWDLTGAYLLSCGLPLKSLYVMGKKPCVVPPLTPPRSRRSLPPGAIGTP